MKKCNMIFVVFGLLFLTSCAVSQELPGTTENKNNTKSSSAEKPTDKSMATKSTQPNVIVPSQQTNPQTGQALATIVPNGWQVLDRGGGPEKVQGDLNQDGVEDMVAVLEKISEAETEEASPRSLLIAWGHSDQTVSLSIIADRAMMTREEGGVWGDPFESISIDQGTVVLRFYGGSNYRWYARYRFRYQDAGWYLIGATRGDYFTGDSTIEEHASVHANEEDYHLLTGDVVLTTKDENGVVKTKKSNRGKKPLVDLKDFSASSYFEHP